ncbi:MAG: SDR family oxidoreductase [Pseudonocardiaceae bacterium]|nr:SDR family oxidoreductase [Pseudonocardiaceae bacterium]
MIVVTGATGQLGRRVIEGLLARVPANELVAAVRSPEKATDLAAAGVQVREADYDRPETVDSALKDANIVLLISANVPGKRVAQHAAVVDAAKRAGARHLVYTSAPHADTTDLVVAPEHKATEQLILDSGLPFTFLRNGWYHENYVATITRAATTGEVVGVAGNGRVASAARADYADAAVAVLTGEGHESRIYELSGDTAWTYAELAAEIAKVAGRPVAYRDLTPEQLRATLVEAGTPTEVAGFLVALDHNIAAGALAETSGELRELTGRPTTPLTATIEAVLRT